jgi:hypothetical protein
LRKLICARVVQVMFININVRQQKKSTDLNLHRSRYPGMKEEVSFKMGYDLLYITHKTVKVHFKVDS